MLEQRITARGGSVPMRLDWAEDDQSHLIVIHGELDVATVGRFRIALDRAVAGSAPEVVIDLGFCSFIDSHGVAALLGINRRLSRRWDRDFVILPGPPAVQRVFEVCDLLDVLPFAG